MTSTISTIAKTIALTTVHRVGEKRVRELIEDFGSPEEVFEADQSELEPYHYLDGEIADQLDGGISIIDELEEDCEQWLNQDIDLIPFFDSRYPDQLNEVGGPVLLYAQGKTELLQESDCVGFTGTREASAEAIEWTRTTARELAEKGRTVISGGATGIDTAAHQGTLEANGNTIVVLGTGVNTPYPKSNAQLFDRIVENDGLLLSQRKPDASPSRAGFLDRNSTLTGLSRTVTVVATDGSGGTMATYRDAKSQNRQIVCPDPELELEPVQGVKEILEKEANSVRDAREIVNYQESSDAVEKNQSHSRDENKNKQSSIDDYSD